MSPSLQILQGDWIEPLRTLPEKSVQTVPTSPPYWGLRDYGHKDQLGQEDTPEEYVAKLVRPMILAGSRPGDTILDPFGGSGTTAAVALEFARSAIVCELNPDYGGLIRQRCAITPGLAL